MVKKFAIITLLSIIEATLFEAFANYGISETRPTLYQPPTATHPSFLSKTFLVWTWSW